MQGIHLIKHAAWRTLERGAQFVLLGSAPDPKVQVCSLVADPSQRLPVRCWLSPLQQACLLNDN